MDDMDWCEVCDAPQPIEEQSVETAGYEERQRDYYVIRLGCGHEISFPYPPKGRHHD